MANKWADGFEIITNSAQFVERDTAGKLKWVPSVGNNICFFIQDVYHKEKVQQYNHKRIWEIPLNPPQNTDNIQLIGDTAYSVSDICAPAIYAIVKNTDFIESLSELAGKGSAWAGCENGRYLGVFPAIQLSRVLKEQGYGFEISDNYPEYPLFYQAGRGKRTLTNLFSVHKRNV